MFADFFSPTTVGVCLIILAYFSFMQVKIFRINDEENKDLKNRIYATEGSFEQWESRCNILQKQISYLQKWKDKPDLSLCQLEVQAEVLRQEIKKDSDIEIFEWSDDDFQDEDDETKE